MHSMNGAMHHSMNSTLNSSIMNDAISEPSSPESTFDNSNLLNSSMNDDVTSQLMAAGPIGIAAAAAIATGKKRKRPHSFETNPSIRKRQQTRLMRYWITVLVAYFTLVGVVTSDVSRSSCTSLMLSYLLSHLCFLPRMPLSIS